jgi:hypothetical protein
MSESLTDLTVDKTITLAGVEIEASLTFSAACVDNGAGDYEHFGYRGTDRAYCYEPDGGVELFLAESVNSACRATLDGLAFPKSPRRRYLRALRLMVKQVNTALAKIDPADLLTASEFDRAVDYAN